MIRAGSGGRLTECWEISKEVSINDFMDFERLRRRHGEDF